MMKKQREEEEEEEGAALVPPPQPQPDGEHGGGGGVPKQQQQQHLDDDDVVVVDQPCSPSSHRQAAEEASSSSDDTTSYNNYNSKTATAATTAWWSWIGRRQKLQVPTTRSAALVIAGLVALACLLVGSTSSGWIHLDYASSSSFLLGGGGARARQQQPQPHHVPSPAADLVPIPFSCGGNSSSAGSPSSWTCRRRTQAPSPSPSPSSSSNNSENDPRRRCPEYFRYIHSDLSPWRSTGITREAVERGRPRAAFRLVVVDGRAYVETYHRVFQTRDTFTQWGIAQLLARYPGRVPDLDLMFNCEDMPEVRRRDFPVASDAPPLFRYCKDDATLDVVFPDWSFWGWPEVSIRPWAPLLEEMAAETARLPWADRAPYAYWKGNPGVSGERRDLLRCNSTSRWGAALFAQDWRAAIRAGFKDSNLARQCTYRYKVYVRGRSWSVSEKYILACDSPVLLVDTPFQDFFSRGLVAGDHYWPIDPKRKCAAIKAAVDWGNAHPAAARAMAERGSSFARRDLSMDYVYDYMLHLLTQYAALLRYKPTVPEKAVELCPETVACPAAEHSNSREFRFMMESRERYVADYQPCTLPPPFTDDEMREMKRREEQVRADVKKMTIG